MHWKGGRTPPPSGCRFFTGPWTVTRSSLCMLRRVAAFCRPLRPVLPLVSFPRSRSPAVGVPGLCWMWRDVPFARQWRPVVGILRLCWLLWGWFDCFDCFCCPHLPLRAQSANIEATTKGERWPWAAFPFLGTRKMAKRMHG